MRLQVDSFTVAIVAIVLIVAANAFINHSPRTIEVAAPPPPPMATSVAAQPTSPDATGGIQVPVPTPTYDPNQGMVGAPYEEYIVTQGAHGQSYGHLAIDIAAGKGTTILSPINGVVTQRYTDQWGNPTIVIENDYYQVTMLHGLYTADIGTPLRIGQPVGTESNIGYTMDMLGRLCTNRDCGYHTHLNIFDKRRGMNVDPLNLITPSK